MAPTPSRWTDAIIAIADDKPEEAARIYGEIGSLPNQAQAHLRAASKLVASGRRAEADVALDFALAFWRDVGATSQRRQADRALGAGRRPYRYPGAASGRVVSGIDLD